MNPAALYNDTVTEEATTLPVYASVDVAIVGGGSAGWHAAVAAGRAGAKTLLIERDGTLGGTVTNALVQPFMSYHDQLTNAVVGGSWGEMIKKLADLGGTTGPLDASDGKPPWGRHPSLTPFEPEILRFVAQEMVLEAGADMLLHTLVSNVILDDSTVKGLIIENKSGRQAVLAKCTVDASGDADVVALSGAPFVLGRESDGKTMPMSLYIKLSHVDYSAMRTYVEQNMSEFRWWSFPVVDESLPAWFEHHPVSASGFLTLVREAREAGRLYLGRETINVLPCPRRGEAVLNCTRVGQLDPTSARDLTRAEIDARRQAMSVVQFAQRELPGFAAAELEAIAPTIGVRESRRVIGEYILTLDDVINGATFPDVIARSAYNVDIHNPDDDKSTWHQIAKPYDIPYRCLVPLRMDNLLVAGRCISTTHEASGSARMTPHVAATGQAAGTAAALCVAGGGTPRNINFQELQMVLKRNGAILG